MAEATAMVLGRRMALLKAPDIPSEAPQIYREVFKGDLLTIETADKVFDWKGREYVRVTSEEHSDAYIALGAIDIRKGVPK